MITINISKETAIRILEIGKAQAQRALNAAKAKYGATHAVTQQLTIDLAEIQTAITEVETKQTDVQSHRK